MLLTNELLEKLYNSAFTMFNNGENKGHIMFALLNDYDFLPPSLFKQTIDTAEFEVTNNFCKFLFN